MLQDTTSWSLAKPKELSDRGVMLLALAWNATSDAEARRAQGWWSGPSKQQPGGPTY